MPFQAGHEEVICQAGSVRGGRYPGGVFIETHPDFDEDQFDAVVSMLGLTGIDSYDIAYDPETGAEVYLIQVPVVIVEEPPTFLDRGFASTALAPMTVMGFWLAKLLIELMGMMPGGSMPV